MGIIEKLEYANNHAGGEAEVIQEALAELVSNFQGNAQPDVKMGYSGGVHICFRYIEGELEETSYATIISAMGILLYDDPNAVNITSDDEQIPMSHEECVTEFKAQDRENFGKGDIPQYYNNCIIDIVEVDYDPHDMLRKLIRHFSDPAILLGKLRESTEKADQLRKRVDALHKQYMELCEDGRYMFQDKGLN